MKSGIKYLLAGLLTIGMTVGAYAGNITVNSATQVSSYVTDRTGAPNYLDNDLIEVGAFSVAPSPGNPSLGAFVVLGAPAAAPVRAAVAIRNAAANRLM